MRSFVAASALAGAVVWFVVFFGPQWGFLSPGYRPNVIILGAALLLVGVGGQALWRRPSTFPERLGMSGLLASVVLIAAEAPGWSPVGDGVALDATIDDWTTVLGVRLLPFATAALLMSRAGRIPGAQKWVLTAGVALSVLAVLLAVPGSAARMEPWDFVARHAFLLAALILVAIDSYWQLEGPSLRLVRNSRSPA